MKLWEYVVRRLLLLVPVLLGVSVITFALTFMVGDPAAIYITERMTPQQIDAVRAKYGFNQPVVVQYFRYIGGVLQGDWGYSRVASLPVTDAIRLKFPATFELTTLSMLLAVVVGIPLGIISGSKRNQPVDHFSRVFALAGSSIPIFWLGIMLKYVFAYEFGWLPLGGQADQSIFYSTLGNPDWPRYTYFYTLDSLLNLNLQAFGDAILHLLLPAVTLSYASMAIITRMMRSSMLEVLNQEYIKTARSKGLSERIVINRHARRNALIPTTTVVGLSFGALLGGAVLTETIFQWPGLGWWSAQALLSLDRAAIMGFTILTAIIYVVVNLVVDIIYAYLDPRIRLGV